MNDHQVDSSSWIAAGALMAGFGSMLSGWAALKTANKRGREEEKEEEDG